MTKHLCTECYGGHVEDKRAKYLMANKLRMTCMQCGEALAKERTKSYCIAPMHKSNYMLITNMEDLKGLNNKGGLIK